MAGMSATPRLSAHALADPAIRDPVYRFAEASHAVATAEDLEALMQRYLAPYQAASYTLYSAMDAQRRPMVTKISGISHPEWRKHYEAHDLAKVDDLLQSGFTSDAPTTWTQFRRAHALSAAQERIYNEAAEHRLKDGFFLPMHRADGSMLGFSMMVAEDLKADHGMSAILHMLALYYALAAERLGLVAAAGIATPAAPADLTPRQVECLQWVAAGKSGAEIGEILGLSDYTVSEHLAAARKRLGVRTTTQAAIQAVLRGLVRP